MKCLILVFQERLKLGKVTPIKIWTKEQVGKLWTCICCQCNVQKRICYKNTDAQIHYSLYDTYQFEFIKKDNTQSATMDFANHIRQKLDKKLIVVSVFIDLKNMMYWTIRFC